MGLKIFALIVLLTVVATALGVVVWLGGLPGRLARDRDHPQREAITVAGWLGLAVAPLWPLALVWAFIRDPNTPQPSPPQPTPPQPEKSRSLPSLRAAATKIAEQRISPTSSLLN